MACASGMSGLRADHTGCATQRVLYSIGPTNVSSEPHIVSKCSHHRAWDISLIRLNRDSKDGIRGSGSCLFKFVLIFRSYEKDTVPVYKIRERKRQREDVSFVLMMERTR